MPERFAEASSHFVALGAFVLRDYWAIQEFLAAADEIVYRAQPYLSAILARSEKSAARWASALGAALPSGTFARSRGPARPL